jgi:hypothetical protein
MSAPKWTIVVLLLATSPAFAQGTQQRASPNGGYTTGNAQPIGSSGAPVATGQYSYSPGAPAQSRIVVTPQRKLLVK